VPGRPGGRHVAGHARPGVSGLGRDRSTARSWSSRCRTPRSRRAVTRRPARPSRPQALIVRSSDRLRWSSVAPMAARSWRRRSRKPGCRYARRLPQRWGLHGLRHYYATLLIHAGASVKTVQLALGRSTPTITLNEYVHEWPDVLDRTRSLVDGALGKPRSGGHVGWEPGVTAASRVVAVASVGSETAGQRARTGQTL
jgi:hypothetical protein